VKTVSNTQYLTSIKQCYLVVAVSVSFTERQYMVGEGARRLRVGLILSRNVPMEITVRVVLSGITAEGNAIKFLIMNLIFTYQLLIVLGNMVDFGSADRSVTFSRRTRREFINIPIINDNITEPLENFSLAIEIPPQFSNIGVILGDPAVATGFIIDDDGMDIIIRKNTICISSQLLSNCKKFCFEF